MNPATANASSPDPTPVKARLLEPAVTGDGGGAVVVVELDDDFVTGATVVVVVEFFGTVVVVVVGCLGMVVVVVVVDEGVVGTAPQSGVPGTWFHAPVSFNDQATELSLLRRLIRDGLGVSPMMSYRITQTTDGNETELGYVWVADQVPETKPSPRAGEFVCVKVPHGLA